MVAFDLLVAAALQLAEVDLLAAPAPRSAAAPARRRSGVAVSSARRAGLGVDSGEPNPTERPRRRAGTASAGPAKALGRGGRRGGPAARCGSACRMRISAAPLAHRRTNQRDRAHEHEQLGQLARSAERVARDPAQPAPAARARRARRARRCRLRARARRLRRAPRRARARAPRRPGRAGALPASERGARAAARACVGKRRSEQHRGRRRESAPATTA